MKIKFILAIVLFVTSLPVLADTRVGLGTTLNTIVNIGGYVTLSTGNVFLPIRINDKVLLEPYLIYSKYEEDGEGSYKAEDESSGLGFGAFYIVGLRESIYSYFGGRVSWYKIDSTTTYSTGDQYKNESNNYSIAPVVGLEYKVHDFVFVGLEAGVGYSDGKEKYEDPFQESSRDADSNYVSTFTNIMLRMMF